MVISRNTLKRLPTKTKNTFSTGTNGLYFSKSSARLLNMPCYLSFDFDDMTCFHDENGFEAVINQNGFFIHSKILARFIREKFESRKVKFELRSTIKENLFSFEIIKSIK